MDRKRKKFSSPATTYMNNNQHLYSPKSHGEQKDISLFVDDSHGSVMERALTVQANLEPQFPSFVKSMLRSHVTWGFWLSFPKRFCDSHLPKEDVMIILVDDVGERFEAKYLVDKNGLSGGWRGFSMAHQLLEGDCLIFQLIQPYKFKVYIVRATSLNEIDGAIILLNLDSSPTPVYPSSPPIPICLLQQQEDVSEQPGNESDDFSSDDSISIGFSDGNKTTKSNFRNVNTLEDFTIQVDGLVINPEIPTYLRKKYYDLCRNRKGFLHEKLLKGLNMKLVAGIISETVNIAEAIQACRIPICRENVEIWGKTLNGFENLGMEVGFLIDRVDRLEGIVLESEKAMEDKKRELGEKKEEMRELEMKLVEVKRRLKGLGCEVEDLKLKGEKKMKGLFLKEAMAPW